MDAGATSPSKRDVGVTAKIREWTGYFRKHRRNSAVGDDIPMFLQDIDEYDALLRRHCGRDIGDATVLELGFGTRAERLAILSAAGARATGIDIEVPMLRLDSRTMREILRRNGAERLVKSAARHLLFDRAAKRRLAEALGDRFGSEKLTYGRMVIGDAGAYDFVPGSFDLVTSEDVLEHMTVESIEKTLDGVRRALRDRGIALLRPNIYPGISGGHLTEWYQSAVLDNPEAPRLSDPWDHLRGRRFEPNTFLNELTRADYRRLFAAADFEILEERVRHPELGASLLTPEVRSELASWSDEELFSNQVMFVLRPVETPSANT